MRAAQRPLRPGWVAGSARARHLLGRCLGRRRGRQLAASPSLEDALATLAGTAYGRRVRAGMDLAEAQRATAATALWHIRVLAGWLPPGAVSPVAALAAWFELSNVEDRLRYLAGRDVAPAFELGALAAAWPGVGAAQSPGEVRARLAGSAWGDPGSENPAELVLALRFAWARRVLEEAEEAAEWAAGAVALLIARELLVAGRSPAALLARRPPGVGSAWVQASSPVALRDALPPSASWVLGGVEQPGDLWRAEVGWWRRVEEDARRLARDPAMGRTTVIGSVVLIGLDAWRTSGALEAAARRGTPMALEVFDEIG